MKLALIQMVSGGDVATNLTRAAALLAQAQAAGAELAVLPEFFCQIGSRDADKLAIQEPAGDGPLQRFLADEARTRGLWIAGGTVPLSTHDPAHVTNSCLVYGPDGRCHARYDKIHLFRYDNGRESYDESRVLQGGHTPVSFDLPSCDGHTWRVVLSVCYDLRFPELYRQSATQAAHLLLVPSAFTYTTGQAHWETLLRARAIENLAFVGAAAQGGHHDNGRRTWGHSVVMDPWGRTLDEWPEGEGLAVAELDWALLHQLRQQLPALTHRVL